MGIFDNDIKLPGVITQVEADYSYGYDPTAFGTTDSEVVIGTAFNGPVGTPTPVYSVEHAAYIFGPVYDNETRKETSLVAGIQDAWDRGCRTIYAVRVGGKDIYKDFNFCVDNGYKIRLSSQFPTNTGKKCFFVYSNKAKEESLTFYKPAERATISEKRRGVVTSSGATLKTTLRINQDYGLRPEDRLLDLIEIFNNHPNNNVLKLTIVNKDGVDVTSSPEVYNITIGSLFPGLYLIGHDKTKVEEHTDVAFRVTKSATDLPFSNIKDSYFKVLELNTDISVPYPIYTNSLNKAKFGELFGKVEITVSAHDVFSFLDTTGVVNRAYPEDKIDYEETSLSNFEIYKRLGSGFALTAVANKRLKNNGEEAAPRISEAEAADPNRVVPLVEGIYSMLENAEIKYRALVCVNADDKIHGKLPKPQEFRKATPVVVNIVNKYIELTPKIDELDFTDPIQYTFKLQPLETVIVKDIDKVYTKEVFPIVTSYTGDAETLAKEVKEGKVPNGSLLVASDNKLYRVSSSELKALDKEAYKDKSVINADQVMIGQGDDGQVTFNTPNPKVTAGKFEEKEYVLGTTLDTIFVFKIEGDKLKALGDFKTVYSPDGEEPPIAVYAESFYKKDNPVIINSALFENISLSEMNDLINNNEVLNKLFTATLNDTGMYHADEMIKQGDNPVTNPGIMKDLTENNFTGTGKCAANKTIGYDYNMHIPYATTDNFVRQLAQHCTYTELKTIPTFGFIGCQRLVNTGLSSVADKTKELVEHNFDLYAKTQTGRNMLDRQNMPYPIGKNVSVVFTQYPIYIQNTNYRYTSNGAAGYAGMVSHLPLDQSSTYQKIDLSATDFICSENQLNQLTAAGIVTVRKSLKKGLVITDGVTMAPSDSIYRRLSASRIVGAVEDLIRQACEPFIGKQNHTANRNAIKTAIKSSLDKITGTLVERYTFTINNDPSIMKYSYIDINYQIVPIYEIREIRNNIKVTDRIETNN